jgi:hypothetical protein
MPHYFAPQGKPDPLPPVRCREDGFLEGVRGPLFPTLVDRTLICQRMGWEDGGGAEGVITRTMALLREGKAVELKSHYGWNLIQPLRDDEDGARIPASAAAVYNSDGELIRRVVA